MDNVNVQSNLCSMEYRIWKREFPMKNKIEGQSLNVDAISGTMSNSKCMLDVVKTQEREI